MTLELYQEVALVRDVPEHHLRAGDIATLIDFVSNPQEKKKDACWRYLTRWGNLSRW
jgi:hypothetical protein